MRESNRSIKVQKFVHHIELVQRKSIMYYQQQKSQNFLKIVLTLPTMESTCLGILHRGIQISGLGMKSFQTYESHVPFDLRFMIDCNIVGGNWGLKCPVGNIKRCQNHCHIANWSLIACILFMILL
ncbi:hypothetical protein ARALYDRAFT_899561 [Arabidopsis lyrata subsp. lyrata]|uniref:DNA polymerase delta/zeta catalytic subunit N-terminal domain-containing protein n=1 Tax=Arabidopsis lyrata subsp. lyrata TaxID=81972 RepID=D7L017_ARALL|nr:hypothetical protein ARALYDRAFT_899561 [Arabidopsis lyrata subsp. lyrata]